MCSLGSRRTCSARSDRRNPTPRRQSCPPPDSRKGCCLPDEAPGSDTREASDQDDDDDEQRAGEEDIRTGRPARLPAPSPHSREGDSASCSRGRRQIRSLGAGGGEGDAERTPHDEREARRTGAGCDEGDTCRCSHDKHEASRAEETGHLNMVRSPPSPPPPASREGEPASGCCRHPWAQTRSAGRGGRDTGRPPQDELREASEESPTDVQDKRAGRAGEDDSDRPLRRGKPRARTEGTTPAEASGPASEAGIRPRRREPKSPGDREARRVPRERVSLMGREEPGTAGAEAKARGICE